MSTVIEKPTLPTARSSLLHSGDRMVREEFHEVYLETPEKFKAELLQAAKTT